MSRNNRVAFSCTTEETDLDLQLPAGLVTLFTRAREEQSARYMNYESDADDSLPSCGLRSAVRKSEE